MRVSIHQPHFLAWLGYFNKVVHSDVFVWLNNVQFRRRYYQNRCKIRNGSDWMWLGVPVSAERETLIDQVQVPNDEWRTRVPKSIECSYGNTPCFDSCFPPLLEAMHRAAPNLDDIDYQTFLALMDLLGYGDRKIERANEMPLRSADPTGRLVEICQQFGATEYLAGRGGHNYMDTDQFERAGIRVVWQEFDFNTVRYPQKGKEFLPGLSLIDPLFNVGPEATRALIEDSWKPGDGAMTG